MCQTRQSSHIIAKLGATERKVLYTGLTQGVPPWASECVKTGNILTKCVLVVQMAFIACVVFYTPEATARKPRVQ